MSSPQIQASHILIKHQQSRNPKSWKDPNGSQITQRSKQQAIQILQQHRNRILNHEATFSDIARTESDCSSARSGGDLGLFGRGQMQKPFEDAAYALNVGEISDIVESDSGVHIIQRTA